MPEYREKVRRLEARIEVLERRNQKLRDEVELARIGKQTPWTSFQEANLGVFGDGRLVKAENYRTFLNSRYQVTVFDDGDVIHLSIKRVDGAAVHDWRDFQRIKNELVGPEAEGMELYPAESRLTDGANQYHIWCIRGRIGVGFGSRLVSEDNTDGVTQRLFEADQRPSDLSSITAEAIAKAAGMSG